MRKITLLFIAALISTASHSQVQERLSNHSPRQLSMNEKMETRSNLRLFHSSSTTNQVSIRKAAPKRSIISTQPSGILHDNLYRNSFAYFAYYGYIFPDNVNGAIGAYVAGNDGHYYIKNPISQYATGWLEATKGTGDTLVVTTPQYVLQEEYEDSLYDYYINRMALETTSEGSSYVVDSVSNTVKFVLRNDSLIQVDDVLLGLTDATGSWTGFGDMENVYAPNKDKEVVADLGNSEPENYSLTYAETDTTTDGCIVKVAINGNDIYVKGLSEHIPEKWAKGTINGKKAEFLSDQYLGADTISGYHIYFKGAGSKRTTYSDDTPYDSLFATNKVVFDYDPIAKTLKSDSVILLNGGKNAINYLEKYARPAFKPFNDVAAVPANPAFTTFKAFSSSDGYGYFEFNLPKADVNGDFIDPTKLYYNVYLDDEVFTFLPDEYSKLTSEMTDIPATYSDSWDFFASGTAHTVYYYETGFDKIGVQSIYKGGNTTNKSDIVYYVVPTSIQNTVASTTDAVSETYADISGRKVYRPTKGLYVKTLHYADGSVKSVKVLIR